MRLPAALALVLCACGPGLPTEAPAKDVVRCTDDGTTVSCLHQSKSLPERNVQWQVPAGDAPAAGWPVVIVFHGSFVGVGPSWDAKQGDKWGAYFLAQTSKALLEQGYAVLTPQSIHDGNWFWNTNVVGYLDNWNSSPDSLLMTQLLEAIGDGSFGPLDATRLYATGISSGGYMTSRMAVSYAGRFKALAVHSASYATCNGVTCGVPELPADHPPTLLLHGETDNIVPIATMRAYETKLKEQGLVVETEVSATAGHEWQGAAVARVPAWFSAHP